MQTENHIPPAKYLLNTRQTEKHLNGHVKAKTLANERSERKKTNTADELPYYKIRGRIYYDQRDLDAWLARCRRT
ncbi:MAG TPA: hypothetical protein V6C86_05710 [Oculatellaceae cyanobacterium]